MQLSLHDNIVMDLKENLETLNLGDTDIDSIPIAEEQSSKPTIRRSGRIIRPIDIPLPVPKKKSDSKKQIEKIYLSKTVKRLPSTLETIFEEPKASSDGVQHMSTRKFKRVVSFVENNSPQHRQKRTKSRIMKAKKVGAHSRIKMRKKLGMDLLMQKLHELSDCES